jgi:hypothetical protein
MTAAGSNISPHLGFAQRAPISSPVASSFFSASDVDNTESSSSIIGLTTSRHAQPSPNLPHAAATRQNPNLGMYFPSLHGVQFTPEQIQMEHTMRLMVSGGFYLPCRPKASTATTPYDNAGLSSNGASSSGRPTPGPGVSASSGAGTSTSASTGPRRGTNWIIPPSALRLTPSILYVSTVSICIVSLNRHISAAVPVLLTELCAASRPSSNIACAMLVNQVSYIS